MKKIKVFSVALTIGAATISTSVAAQEEERFVESTYRNSLMEIIGNAVTPAALSLRGLMELPKGHLATSAKTMARTANIAKAAFVKDTRGVEGKTDALDVVWEDWDDFSEKMDKFAADADAYAVTAEGSDTDAIKAAAGALLKNCKACHDTYRKKH